MKTQLSKYLLCASLPFLTPCVADAQQQKTAAMDDYHDYCSVCHGDSGDGQSLAMDGLDPPPLDFTIPGLKVALDKDRMIHAVTYGKPNTAMSGWAGRLTETRIEAIVDYVRAAFMTDSPHQSMVSEEHPGKKIFAENCSVCHGDQGKGAAWGQDSLNPPPRNFTTTESAEILNRERIVLSITHGRPGTAMSAYGGRLSRIEINALADYIFTVFMNKSENKIGNGPIPAVVEVDLNAAMPFGYTGDPLMGNAYYAQNCVACHGGTGGGDGPRAYFIIPPPRNFNTKSSRAVFNRPALFNGIKSGVTGTEMPAWSSVLTEQQIADITEFMFQTFIQPQ